VHKEISLGNEISLWRDEAGLRSQRLLIQHYAEIKIKKHHSVRVEPSFWFKGRLEVWTLLFIWQVQIAVPLKVFIDSRKTRKKQMNSAVYLLVRSHDWTWDIIPLNHRTNHKGQRTAVSVLGEDGTKLTPIPTVRLHNLWIVIIDRGYHHMSNNGRQKSKGDIILPYRYYTTCWMSLSAYQVLSVHSSLPVLTFVRIQKEAGGSNVLSVRSSNVFHWRCMLDRSTGTRYQVPVPVKPLPSTRATMFLL
jgi:hypothetical protein